MGIQSAYPDCQYRVSLFCRVMMGIWKLSKPVFSLSFLIGKAFIQPIKFFYGLADMYSTHAAAFVESLFPQMRGDDQLMPSGRAINLSGECDITNSISQGGYIFKKNRSPGEIWNIWPEIRELSSLNRLSFASPVGAINWEGQNVRNKAQKMSISM